MSETGRPEPCGYTLLEMLVVLAILGLLAGLSFPSVERALDGRRFALAVSATRAGLVAARTDALRTGSPVTFRPNASLDRGLELKIVSGPIRFFPDGSALGGSLELTDGRRRIQFRIEPHSGLIRDEQR